MVHIFEEDKEMELGGNEGNWTNTQGHADERLFVSKHALLYPSQERKEKKGRNFDWQTIVSLKIARH